MIAKADLVHGQYYYGRRGRHGSTARWDETRQVFVYRARKAGTMYFETTRHIEDDEGQHAGRTFSFTPNEVVTWGTDEILL